MLEPGALEARHVRFLKPEWWTFYPPKSAEALARCLAAARVNRLADDEDFRTPWEKGEDGALVDYELAMIRRSAANMRALGLGGKERRSPATARRPVGLERLSVSDQSRRDK